MLSGQSARRRFHSSCSSTVSTSGPTAGLLTLLQVGLVTAVCATCFSLRAILVAAAALDSKDLSLDDTAHPLVNIVYYGVVELLPTAWVLFILRKLPPKRNAEGYTAVPSGPSGEA